MTRLRHLVRVVALVLPCFLLASSGADAAAKGGAKAGRKAKPQPSVESSEPASPPLPAAQSPSETSPPAAASASPAPAPAAQPEALPKEEAQPSAAAAKTPVGDFQDTDEDPMQRYMFIGLRYRGTIIPKFLINMFVDEGGSIYSNSIGLEADFRKDGFSLVPSISYTEYGTGDMIFAQKNKDRSLAGNWAHINSSMKALYLATDLLWSTKLRKNLDFEYGFGVGIGIVFGNLVTNWVYFDPNGPYAASDGTRLAPCSASNTQTGCNSRDHYGSDVRKVDGYVEPSWFSGGSRPNFFPHISIPQFGLRFKPDPKFQARLGIGMSLTGFWFGLGGSYGLTEVSSAAPKETPKQPASE